MKGERKGRHTAYIGVGSNIGDRNEYIRRAERLLNQSPGIRVVRISPIYETEPWGYESQGKFLNCVFEAATSLTPNKLLRYLIEVEKRLGRERTIPNGPRTIDLDILFYDDLVLSEDDLIIPHPRLHERLFVLRPLFDLTPNYVHPVFGETVSGLKDKLD